MSMVRRKARQGFADALKELPKKIGKGIVKVGSVTIGVFKKKDKDQAKEKK